jgi:L-threonylcarbamoyladenylate synthase
MLITKDISAIISLVASRMDAAIAYPTETFYGLGARIADAAGIARIIRAKGRDATKGMIVLAADMAMAASLAEIDARTQVMLERFWPGPLSAILKANPGIHPLLCVDGKISLRISSHALANALCRELGPITSTSVNPSGMPPARTVAEVLQYDLDIDAVLDGAETPGGAPSTVIDLTSDPPVCIRAGAIPWDEILGLITKT